MQNFIFENPSRILFGRDQIGRLAQEIKKHHQRILLVYGGGSIKRSGLFDQIAAILRENNIFFVEQPGVMVNPRIESVYQGVKLCRENDLGLVLAVGGGSVIDCAKTIAAGFFYDGDPWDFFSGKARVGKALPVGVVLTLAATGSEMNPNAVISNEDTREKIGIGGRYLYPRFAILDPAYTFSVPPEQTAAGTADIISHVFEQYFSANQGAFLQDRMCEAVLKTCIKYAPVAIKEPANYEARANLMWAGAIGLNGILSTGKDTDWATHEIEHELSAFFDMTHGLGLAILIPHWMNYVLDETNAGKFAEYARNVWGIAETDDFQAAKEGIKATANFFASLGLGGTLSGQGVTRDSLAVMAEKAAPHSLGSFRKLDQDDVLNILKAAF